MIEPPASDAPGSALAESVAAAITGDGTHRLIVAVREVPRGGNPDVLLSQVVAVLMRRERLDVEVAYVPDEPTRATAVYGLPHGRPAWELAENGAAQRLPLIRDDAATVLVGRARQLGAGGDRLFGESYADSDRLFDGEVRGVVIEPLTETPGVRARVQRRLPGGWRRARAVQTGGTNVVVEREGELTERVVKRSTFYRHHEDWLLVRPAPTGRRKD